MGTFIFFLLVLSFGIGIGFILGFSRTMHRVALRLQRPNRSRFNAKLMSVIGAAMLAVGLVFTIHTWHFVSVAKRTTGTVIKLREQSGKNSENHGVAPDVRYQDSSGTFHTNSSRLYSYPPRFRIGDTVPVLFQVDDPDTGRIDSFFDLWGVPVIVAGLGVLVTAVGVIIFLRQK
jgi:hypothetical protein